MGVSPVQPGEDARLSTRKIGRKLATTNRCRWLSSQRAGNGSP